MCACSHIDMYMVTCGGICNYVYMCMCKHISVYVSVWATVYVSGYNMSFRVDKLQNILYIYMYMNAFDAHIFVSTSFCARPDTLWVSTSFCARPDILWS